MNPRYCMACGECVKKCPKKVIGQAGFPWHRHVFFKHAEACFGCGKCIKTCPNGVFFKPGEPVPDRKTPTGMSSRIERLLPVVFLASAVTGIGLHAAGHGTNHEIWHNWSIAHITTSLLWLLAVAVHIKRHRLWYKSLLSKGLSHKTPDNLFPVGAFPDGLQHRYSADNLRHGSKHAHRAVALQTRTGTDSAFTDSYFPSPISTRRRWPFRKPSGFAHTACRMAVCSVSCGISKEFRIFV